MQNLEKKIENNITIDDDIIIPKIKHYYFKIPELIRMVFWALVIVIPIKLWIISPTMVIGSSMSPNYETGDYVLISKLTSIDRGDVIAIKPPKNEGFWGTSYLKRLIALPGETIKIKDSKTYVKTVGSDDFIELKEPYVKNHLSMPNMERTLSKDEYFVMGDNRGASLDSRDLGAFKTSAVVGEAYFRVYGHRKKEASDKETSIKLFFEKYPANHKFKI